YIQLTMKKLKYKNYFSHAFLAISVFLFLMSNAVLGQSKLKVLTDTKVFFTAQKNPYVEVQLQFEAASLKYKSVQQGLQAELALDIAILQNGNKITGDAYRLMSPIFRDSMIEDFFEIRRFALAKGKYELKIKLWDLNSSENSIEGSSTFEVQSLGSHVMLSPIQICEYIKKSDEETVFNRSGYFMLPRLVNYFPSQNRFLPVYLEIYSDSKDTVRSILEQDIIDVETGKELIDYSKAKRVAVLGVTPWIQKIDINSLKSGRYRLVYRLLDPKNDDVISQSEFEFVRSNELANQLNSAEIVLDPSFQKSIHQDSLEFFVKSLLPIINQGDQAVIFQLLKEKSTEKYRKYLQAFWVESAGRLKAYESWMSYKAQVMLVQKLYATNFAKGFETDRGRVYLQYGAPSAIASRETSPSEYPYEVWQYDKIKNFSNKRFVFYNPD
ncbi:MAG: GWxTD domain-containing protein, partial [Crocinitomicaceae bacterium]|nr:GWxTD domain-containing protein [Crocinitomicaceae bacterium]